ncbi:MAG: CpaF family protein [Actinomycetales bacterium]
MTGLAQIEDEVRTLVRRRGLDPQTQRDQVRAVVDEVVRDYDRRALGAALPPLGDLEAAARAAFDAVAGLGPLQELLDDPEVEEVWINAPDRVFAARHGRSELTNALLTEQQVRDLVERMLTTSGRRIDLSAPGGDAALPDGSRLHVVIPDVAARHWLVNIRKFVARASSLDDLVRLGTVTSPVARFLHAAVVSGLNVLVSGATQAGKTTMLNCLLDAVPAYERVVTCEEVFELKCSAPDTVAMQTRQPSLEGTGEVTLRRLVKEALRMRPSRLVIGEVRQEESLDMLLALNAGLPGMCTVHANSARDALAKMCTLPLLAGPNVNHHFVVPAVAASVDLIVHLANDAAGARRVREVLAVPGRVEGDVIETAMLFEDTGDGLARASGFPPHPERFARHGFDVHELLTAAS